jgi:hypothetical protein
MLRVCHDPLPVCFSWTAILMPSSGDPPPACFSWPAILMPSSGDPQIHALWFCTGVRKLCFEAKLQHDSITCHVASRPLSEVKRGCISNLCRELANGRNNGNHQLNAASTHRRSGPHDTSDIRYHRHTDTRMMLALPEWL